MTIVPYSQARRAARRLSKPARSSAGNGAPGANGSGSVRRVPLTVEQYHRMIETGILAEGAPVELLGGTLVRKDRSAAGEDPMSVGLDHIYSVQALAELDPKLRRLGCYIRIQQPVTIPDFDEPEPDGAIVKESKEDYRSRNPNPGEVSCIIEVADSSLRIDRAVKLPVYADAGIPQYVIVNLVDRVVKVYSQPLVGRGHYAEATTLRVGQRVELLTSRSAGGKGGKSAKNRLAVAVKHLLPPAPQKK